MRDLYLSEQASVGYPAKRPLPKTQMSSKSVSTNMHRRSLRGVCTMHLLLLVFFASLCSSTVASKYNNFNQCATCDESRCPELHYCEGQPIKDHCGCCTICSSSRFQPHVVVVKPAGGNACEQVDCPKFKVCVENMQGVPLCTCPSEFVCRRNKKREVCGTDGKTYPSRCHMRIASCNQGVAVRKMYRGPCSPEDEEKEAAKYNRRLKKMKRRRRQRKRKANESAGEKGKKRRKHRRRRRRKSGSRNGKGKSRRRRHRGSHSNAASRTFEEAFAQYTWKA